MKNPIQILFAACTVALLAGCQKEPSASIDTNKSTIEVGETITFFNDSKDGKSYSWDFGDGTTSTDEEPSKTYSSPGKYTVRLTAYSKNKKKEDEDRVTITVNEPAFVGTHQMHSDYSSSECLFGILTYTSSSKTYQLVIRKGSKDNEILIDNLGGLGINNVKATVSHFTFFGLDEYSFTVAPGQTLTDSKGKTWTYNSNGINGEYESSFKCRSIYVYLQRTEFCDGFESTIYYSENASKDGC